MAEEPNEGTPGQDPTTEGGGQDPASAAPAATTLDPEATRRELERARSEAAERRTALKRTNAELEAAKAKLAELEKAQLSDQERLARENEELKAAAAQAARQVVDARILVEAAKQGFADPEDALALIDRSAVGDGQDGEAVAKALQSVLKKKPYLKAPSAAPSTAGTPGNPPGGAGAAADAAKQERVRQIFPYLAGRR